MSPLAGGAGSLRELSYAECLELLDGTVVGRIGLSVGSLPVVLPVNFVVDDGSLVFCTGPGTKLSSASDGNVACLEVDDFESGRAGAWSVLATGRLHLVDDPVRIDSLRERLDTWRRIAEPRYIELSIDLLSGRRLVAGEPVASVSGSDQPD